MRGLALLGLLLAGFAWAGGSNDTGASTYGPGSNLQSVGAYTVASASDFDGTNDFITRGADLTGAADGKTGTIHGCFRIDGGNGTTRWITITGDSFTTMGLSFGLSAANALAIQAKNAAGTTILQLIHNASLTAGATWYCVDASWDLAAGVGTAWLNGVEFTYTAFAANNDTIDYTKGNWAIGAETDGGGKWNGCLADLWFRPVYIDLSLAANRARFRTVAGKPARLGYSGQLPTGTTALIYHPDGSAAERGTAGAWTLTGALDACSSLPN